MIKIENLNVWGFEHAIRGMRNPMNSWDKSDSHTCGTGNECDFCMFREEVCGNCYIGKNDLTLMHNLYKAGTEHRKYLRQITVSMDITAPLYWWKEMDQYRINVTTNSCSTMHKISAKEFEPIDFSTDHLTHSSMAVLDVTISALNVAREDYLKTKNKEHWWQMIQLLPSSYNQRRTITMNYENVVSIIKQRTGHKLDEWNEFVSVLEKLPYVKEIIDGC